MFIFKYTYIVSNLEQFLIYSKILSIQQDKM